MSERNRLLAAALGFVAATGVFGAFETFGNFALFGDETTTAAGSRPIVVVEPKGGAYKSPTGRQAFLVAADDYGDAADPLPCTKNDVKALKARLEKLGFTTVVLETGDNRQTDPTKTIIEREFKKFVKRLRPGDFALVYLSGHGLQPLDSEESFFAPVDVDVEDVFGSSVSINEMLDALKASDATFRWAIVDACRDDPLNPEGESTASPIRSASKSFGAKSLGQIANVPDSVALLQSCQPGKRSYEGGEKGAEHIENGFFTLSLLEALDDENSKADANRDGVLTFSETFDYVSLRTNALATRCYGVRQEPNLTGSITNFALLDGLLIDGLTKAKWDEADGLYREACALRTQKRWRDALTKIKKAREINEKREEYKTAEAELRALAESSLKEEATALYQEAVNAFIADDLTTAKSECEASLETFETDAAQKLLTTINDKIAATAIPLQASGEIEFEEEILPSSAWREDVSRNAGMRKRLTVKNIEYAFHWCPPGEFIMGAHPTEENYIPYLEKQHRVRLTRGFWIMETEVTQAMWESVMNSNPSFFSSMGKGADSVRGLDTSKFPVEYVSWNDCQTFIRILNEDGYAPNGFEFRLPTEAQWEYACRAGTTGPYNVDGVEFDDLGWYFRNSGGRTNSVGLKKPNNWGLYDMHGNVLEYCSDRYDGNAASTYAAYIRNNETVEDPTGLTSGTCRIERGGGWWSREVGCSSSMKLTPEPTIKSQYTGFRLILVEAE